MARSKKQLADRLERIKIANWLLEWLDARRMYRGANAFKSIIFPFATGTRFGLYEVWKGWDILKEAGRRSAQPGINWVIINFEPVEADADGNIKAR